MQEDPEAHATLVSIPAVSPIGLGVLCPVQFLPFHLSARVVWLALVLTASQFAGEEHETSALETDPLAFPEEGSTIHVEPFHRSAKVTSVPVASLLPKAKQSLLARHEIPPRKPPSCENPWVDVEDQRPALQRSAMGPEVVLPAPSPTAMHALERQETASNSSQSAPPTFGVDSIVHLLPFQLSANVPNSRVPTGP
jgi:hypothetical protein